MPKFFHELPEAKELIETLANDMNLYPFIVEKDYWVMHCLWGLQQHHQLQFEMKGGTSLSKGWCCIDRFSEDIDIRFDPPPKLNLNGEKKSHINARFDFYDQLAKEIQIPGIVVVRNRNYDDEKARNGGISLNYDSYFSPEMGLTSGVLLEVGFDTTAPNEPKNFTSWALERAWKAEVEVLDNRAPGIKCFNPEYTFVDKLQTICRRFRQHEERNDPIKDRPRVFLRHYYDLYKLLELDRVKVFIGTEAYKTYKEQRVSGKDLEVFKSAEAFNISDARTYQLFEQEFESVKSLFWSSGPTFAGVVQRIRNYAPSLCG